MKTLKIYKREVTERTGYRKYPFKTVTQYSVFFNGKEYSNHWDSVDNPGLRIKFNEILNVRSSAKAAAFAQSLNRTNEDKWLKKTLEGLGVLARGTY